MQTERRLRQENQDLRDDLENLRKELANLRKELSDPREYNIDLHNELMKAHVREQKAKSDLLDCRKAIEGYEVLSNDALVDYFDDELNCRIILRDQRLLRKEISKEIEKRQFWYDMFFWTGLFENPASAFAVRIPVNSNVKYCHALKAIEPRLIECWDNESLTFDTNLCVAQAMRKAKTDAKEIVDSE